jgi:membrane protease YdiL (CAAX protease family)/uncharacterized RDD family membrane protein YckC
VNEEFTAPAPAGTRPVEYATFGRRLGAALLDSLVWIVGLAFFPVDFGDNETAAAIFGLVILSAWFNYFAICEWRWGQTIGKNMVGIRVLPLEGGRVTWQAAALRNLLRLVDLPLAMIGVDYLIVRGSPRRQRLGDRAAKTIVVREQATAKVVAAPEPATGAIPAAPAPAIAAPTAAEIFSDAAEALGRHPAAGSAPPSAAESPPGEAPAAADTRAAAPAGPAGDAAPASPATWGPGVALGGVLAALLGAILVSIPVVAVDPDVGTDKGSSAGNIIVQTIQVIALVGVPLAVALQSLDGQTLRGALRSLGVREFKPSAFGWMGVAVVVYLLIAGIFAALLQPEQDDIAPQFGGVFFQILLIVVAASISEEICFRGFLFGGLRTKLPAIAAALASGAVFGLLHAPTGIEAVPQLIALGAILSLLYDKTGSIVPGVILHALNNSVALLVS